MGSGLDTEKITLETLGQKHAAHMGKGCRSDISELHLEWVR